MSHALVYQSLVLDGVRKTLYVDTERRRTDHGSYLISS